MPEVPFVAGVDPGLKTWLRMRESLRASALTNGGKRIETIPQGIKYRQHHYWSETCLAPVDHTSDLVIKSMEQYEELCHTNIKAALKHAIFATHNRFLHYVVLRVPDINVSLDDFGNTALHLTAYHGEFQKMEILLDQPNIRVNELNKSHKTPLLMSIRLPPVEFHKQAIQNKLVIECGADVNVQDHRGWSALHAACLQGNLDLIAMLLRRRAKVHLLDNKNKDPIEYTPSSCREDVEELFRKYIKRRGRVEHLKMWAHIISRQFVVDVFAVAEPFCIKCKRKVKDCETLKLRDYRYWMLVHDRAATC